MLSNIKYFRQLEFIDHKSYNTYQRARNMNYQFPSLVMFAEGDISFKAAGMFPENDGSTETKRHYIWLATSSHWEWIICHFKKPFLSNWESRTKKHLPKIYCQSPAGSLIVKLQMTTSSLILIYNIFTTFAKSNWVEFKFSNLRYYPKIHDRSIHFSWSHPQNISSISENSIV